MMDYRPGQISPVTLRDPHYQNMGDTYVRALEELVTPHPAVQIPEWKHWTEFTGGLRKREFSILCGSTGSGKTTFLANLSAQLLKQAEPHFVMSVETGETDFMKRILSVLERRDLNTGRPITTDDVTGIHTRHAKLLESGVIEFSLYDNRVKVEQLCHDIRWMVDRHGVKVVMMDNLNFFLEVTSAANSIVEMDRVIHELIVLAKQVDTHLIMVMHPKKTDGGRVESEFDIKGSSTAVQEAHNVFLFNRSPKEAIDSGQSSKYTRELKIAKMRRRGHFVGNAILFESIGTRYEERGYL